MKLDHLLRLQVGDTVIQIADTGDWVFLRDLADASIERLEKGKVLK